MSDCRRGAAICGKRCRRCALWRARTDFLRRRRCWPQAIRMKTATESDGSSACRPRFELGGRSPKWKKACGIKWIIDDCKNAVWNEKELSRRHLFGRYFNIFSAKRVMLPSGGHPAFPLGVAAVQINNRPITVSGSILGILCRLGYGDDSSINLPILLVIILKIAIPLMPEVLIAPWWQSYRRCKDEAVAVKFDARANVRPYRPASPRNRRQAITGARRRCPVFPIEDFGIERQVFRLFPSPPPWNIAMTMSAFCLVW